MTAPEDAQAALRTISRLAEEYGPALDRAFRVLADGALTGPGAERLQAGMAERHAAVRHAFTTAFQQVRALGPSGPPVPEPHLTPPPAPPSSREGFVGGDPDRLNSLSTELGSAGRSWESAGVTLAALLTRLGLGADPGRRVGQAGEWVSSQVTEVNRRRDDLVRRRPQPGTLPAADTGEDFGTGDFGTGEFGALTEPDNVIDALGDEAFAAVEKGADALGLRPLGDAARFLNEEVAEPIGRPFTKGAVEGTIDLGRSLWDFSILRAATDFEGFTKSVGGLKDGLEYGVQHPVEFAGAIVDWDTLTTDPIRWFGKLVPDAIITATTAGSGSAASGARGLGKVSDLTESAGRRLGGLRDVERPFDEVGTMGTRRDHRARNDRESTEPALPRVPGDGELPSGDPVYYRPGSTAIGYDSSTMRNFDFVLPKPGYHDVVSHGNAHGYFEPGRVNAHGTDFSNEEVNPSHIAEAIRDSPYYRGGPIRLISCHTGTVASNSVEIPAAQQVANKLGVPVLAPTSRVGVRKMARTPEEPKVDGDGYWRLFLPITDQ
ncbi:hypothetical protein [Streptosporangium saharense]|uniref:hypothetical protein n=1 Tax=Streptosporangium saharense TaxID=1706840 RepID=UPI00331B9E62